MSWRLAAVWLSVLGAVSRPAYAQGNWFARDRSAGRGAVEIVEESLRIRVTTAPEPGDLAPPLGVEVVVGNTSSERIDSVEVTVASPDGPCGSARLAPIDRGLDRRVHLTCERRLRPQAIDPVWDLNAPLSLTLRIVHGSRVTESTHPAGYLRYAGWPTEIRYGAALGQFLAMARAPAPALDGEVATLRARIERRLGRPMDGSPAARAAAGAGLLEYLAERRFRYVRDNDEYYGPWAATGTTNFPAESLAYNEGACDDLSTLAAFFFTRLEVPFMLLGSDGHYGVAIEVSRGEAQSSQALREGVVQGRCGEEPCALLPVDATHLSDTRDPALLLARSRETWASRLNGRGRLQSLSSEEPAGLSPREVPEGRSWLGWSAQLRVLPPR